MSCCAAVFLILAGAFFLHRILANPDIPLLLQEGGGAMDSLLGTGLPSGMGTWYLCYTIPQISRNHDASGFRDTDDPCK